MITRMNAMDCHAPWQTPTDWYLVASWGDGCDYVVVQGWLNVVAEFCRQVLGGTIQQAVDNNADEFVAYAKEWADEDYWSNSDNSRAPRPHIWGSEIGECAHTQIILLTAPPAAAIYPARLDDHLLQILGRPNFTCAGIAQRLREFGTSIPNKAEMEQAHVLDWLLRLYLKHGIDWAKVGEEELTRRP